MPVEKCRNRSIYARFCMVKYMVTKSITPHTLTPIMNHTPKPLSALIERLEESQNLEDYEVAFNMATISAIDFTPHYQFSAKGYTRSLLYQSFACELVLICWEHGQKSGIHNHSGSDCIMCCLDGELRETLYMRKSGQTDGRSVESVNIISPYHPSNINDRVAVHSIENVYGGRSVSLHLYIPAIKQCKIYDRFLQETAIVNSRFDYTL